MSGVSRDELAVAAYKVAHPHEPAEAERWLGRYFRYDDAALKARALAELEDMANAVLNGVPSESR